jgi:hypothetical protein
MYQKNYFEVSSRTEMYKNGQTEALYRVVQTSVTLKYSLILTGMFRFKPVSQFVERYHSVVSCSLNMEVLISNNFCKFSMWQITVAARSKKLNAPSVQTQGSWIRIPLAVWIYVLVSSM